MTGLGCVSPLGAGVKQTWQRLVAGECGIGAVPQATEYQALGIPTLLAGTVPREGGEQQQQQQPNVAAFDKEQVQKRHVRRQLPDSIAFALHAADEALVDAGLSSALGQPAAGFSAPRAGVAIGTGISGLQDIVAANDILHTRGYRRVSPYLIPNSLVNMAAGLVSISHNLQGPNHSVSTACATGAHSIGRTCCPTCPCFVVLIRERHTLTYLPLLPVRDCRGCLSLHQVQRR